MTAPARIRALPSPPRKQHRSDVESLLTTAREAAVRLRNDRVIACTIVREPRDGVARVRVWGHERVESLPLAAVIGVSIIEHCSRATFEKIARAQREVGR